MMRDYFKITSVIMALTLGGSLAACEKKEAPKSEVKTVKTERVVVEPVTVSSLDRRVTAIEQRNARVDANIHRQRAAAKPAQ